MGPSTGGVDSRRGERKREVSLDTGRGTVRTLLALRGNTRVLWDHLRSRGQLTTDATRKPESVRHGVNHGYLQDRSQGSHYQHQGGETERTHSAFENTAGNSGKRERRPF
ncbi:unnamed protein product [Cyprideis torosa]|uniref:Uncharacterized protein n=1 Tax=Cyprideis torosa TaxID=163714 RepID=A0A7R8WFZ9_9CRUS|nr:unnamed protein product [Cyprideis torosa]CAG0897481.1 unnamed protein product [Cyprideis torosa]